MSGRRAWGGGTAPVDRRTSKPSTPTPSGGLALLYLVAYSAVDWIIVRVLLHGRIKGLKALLVTCAIIFTPAIGFVCACVDYWQPGRDPFCSISHLSY
jgi:hypothetical protein